MKECNINIEQTQAINTSEALYESIRQLVVKALLDIIKQEVDSICGSIYRRGNESNFYRAGSVESRLYDGNQWHRVRCPRVRERTGNGKSREYHIKAMALAKDTEVWKESLMRAILCGVTYSNMNKLNEDVRTITKGSLSKLWVEQSSKMVADFQSESLSEYDIVALMLDGVWLGRNLAAVVALGFDSEGYKRILGFRIGSSENETVCTDLLTSLKSRGLKEPGNRALLVVLDGSKALDKATKNVFNGAVIQRCRIHKERNVRHYAPKKLHSQIAMYFKTLREARTESEAKQAILAMKDLLSRHPQAMASLEESETELTAIHRIEISATLSETFRSTNSIENAFRNVRRHIGRVTSWKEQTCKLWVGSGLILAQETFRRIRGYSEMDALIAALGRASPWGGMEEDGNKSLSESNTKSIDLISHLFRRLDDAEKSE